MIPGTQPTSNEAGGGFVTCEVEERQAASVEVLGPKRRVIRVESEETQDYVREKLAHEDFSQEAADEIGFVPSALSEPRGATHWCDNRCSEQAFRYVEIAQMVTEEGGEARTVNLCRPCCSERLVQQGKQPLRSKECRDCGPNDAARQQCREVGQLGRLQRGIQEKK